MYGYGYKYVNGLVIGAGGGAPFSNTKSLLFDGGDEYVDLGTPISLDLPNEMTASLWIKPTVINASLKFIAGQSNAGAGHYQWFLDINRIAGRVSIGAGNTVILTSSTAMAVNTWNHIAFTRTGISGNWDYVFYLNGVVDGSVTGSTVNAGTQERTCIGRIGDLNALYFPGNIDEVALFNRAATPTEIVTLSTAPTVDLTGLNPIAWYRNGDNGSYKSPQWLIPSNENKDKVSNYSLAFDGLDDKIDLGTISTLNNVSNFSISFRMKMTATTAFNWWFGGYTSAGNNIYIGITGGNTRAYINGAYVQTSITIANKIILGADATVTVVYDGSLVGNLERVKIYVDGQNTVGTPTFGGTIPATTSIGTVGYGFGGLNGNPSFVTGYSDNLLIFDYSLTYAQTLDIYNGGIPKDVSYLNPAHHWKMGDNATFLTNWNVPDSVGSNDGTSANMTIEDRIGEAPNSTNNAVSLNMDFVDVVPDTP